jgi:hypothetical protein
MSPRRDPRQHLVLALVVATAIFSGCIFSPETKDTGPTVTPPPANQDELIQLLSKSYRERDINTFTNLFPSAADEAPYFFFLNAPVNGVNNWDLNEEVRIHRRMFKPEDPLPGETPVDPALWLASITITLNRTASSWVERTDLYKTPTNPEGLDAAKWKASEAEFHADILFETQGDTDYRVDGRHNFIVIEDVTKTSGTDRKYLIYRWEDLDPPPTPKPETAKPTV